MPLNAPKNFRPCLSFWKKREIIKGSGKMSEKLSKDELVGLVKKVFNPKLSDEVVSEYIEILEDNVPHPAPSDLVFWNEEDLSPEEVVEIALAYEDEK